MSGTVRSRERSLLEFFFAQRRDPLGFLERCVREDGDIVAFRLGSRRLLVVADTALIQEVLVRRTREFWKAHVFEREIPWARAILGEGLLMSEGPSWLRQRRLMQPAFHRGRVATYGDVMVERTARLLDEWREGEPRDVYGEMSRLVLDVMARAIFGLTERTADLHAALHDVFAHRLITKGFLYLVPEWVPTPANRKTRSGLRRLDTLVYAAIHDRRARHERREDLLSQLVEARDEDGSRLSDVQVRDEVMSTVVAGHDTLAATLAWVLDVVARRPHVEARLEAELRSALDGRSPRADDLPRLPYLGSVAQEVLRLFPPGKNVVRVAAVDCELAGRRISKGTFLVLSQWVVQRDPRHYERPAMFDPDRWADGLADRLPRGAFFPFGLGPRLCLGYAFAENMLRLVLATVTQRLRLAPVADPSMTEWHPATLRPVRGLWMVPRRRSP